jgi:hypothetical protein
MPFEDFLNYYSDCQICKYHDDFKYTSLRVTTSPGESNWFKIPVAKDGKYFFSVNQTSKRHHDKSEDFQYSDVKYVLADSNGKVLATEYSADREVWADHLVLSTGDYYLHASVQWYDGATRDFVLSSYGVNDVALNQVSKSDIPANVAQAIQSKVNAMN